MGQQPLLSIGASCIEKLPFLELEFMPHMLPGDPNWRTLKWGQAWLEVDAIEQSFYLKV